MRAPSPSASRALGVAAQAYSRIRPWTLTTSHRGRDVYARTVRGPAAATEETSFTNARDVAQRAARLPHAVPVRDSSEQLIIPQLQMQTVVELRRWCVDACPLGTRVLANAAASLLYSFSSFDASGRAAASGRGFPASSSIDRSPLAAMPFSSSAASLRGSKPPVLSQARRLSQRCSCKERLFMRDPRTLARYATAVARRF